MLVTSSSPAPALATRAAQPTASSPVAVRPPCTYTSQPVSPPARALRASIATTIGCARDQLWILDRRRVDRDLVGAGEQEPAHVVDRAHAATDGERHEHLLRG